VFASQVAVLCSIEQDLKLHEFFRESRGISNPILPFAAPTLGKNPLPAQRGDLKCETVAQFTERGSVSRSNFTFPEALEFLQTFCTSRVAAGRRPALRRVDQRLEHGSRFAYLAFFAVKFLLHTFKIPQNSFS
jgi:hypothetical protein